MYIDLQRDKMPHNPLLRTSQRNSAHRNFATRHRTAYGEAVEQHSPG
jgi:hypothetical protein